MISSFSGFNNDQNWFQISTPIQGGNSGGPLVTEAGYVVGVVVATANATRYLKVTGNIPQNVNYAIKSNVLIGFLTENNISNKGSFVGKISVDKVDLATVLVIAKGESIDLSISHQPHRNNEAGPKVSDESREENQSCTYSRQCKGDMNCFNGKCSRPSSGIQSSEIPKESDYYTREENQSCSYSRQCKGDMNCFNGKCSRLRL